MLHVLPPHLKDQTDSTVVKMYLQRVSEAEELICKEAFPGATISKKNLSCNLHLLIYC